MKRSGFLIEKVYSFENLFDAANKAMRGKIKKADVAGFFFEYGERAFENKTRYL